MEVPEEPGFIS